METLLRDIGYSFRRLRKSPAFTAIVVLTLALGIGANTAIFTVVNTVLLKPLEYRAPEQLVTINHFYNSPELNFLKAPVSAIGFRDYRDKTRSFASMAVETGWSANLTGVGDPERIPASRVSGDYFRVLGVAPELGRAIQPDEDEPGKNHVIVISDGLWKRVFGSDSGIVGRAVHLNDESYTVIGVMPPDFHSFFNRSADMWTPLALPPDMYTASRYTTEFLNLVARLAPNTTVDQARAEMNAFAEQLKKEYPDNLGGTWGLTVTSLNEVATGDIRPALLILLGAVGFVLLIACANVANLLLARAAVRIKEVAIRSALGADRWSLIRQLLTESVMLALVGGALGLAVAYWGVRTLLALNPSLPRASEVGLDPVVMLFTLGVSVVTGLLFGLAPALQSSRARLQETLKEGGRSGSADFSGRVLRRTLVIGEMALALTLLIGAGLLIRSVGRLHSVDPGFRPDHLLTFNLALPQIKYPNDTARAQFYDAVVHRIAQVPGVTDAGATSVMPFSGGWSTGTFDVEGYTPGPDQPSPWGDIRNVSPSFFKTLGIQLQQGRVFTDQDRDGVQAVVVVDDRLVQRYFANVNPIGRRLSFGADASGKTQYATIIGVVGHTMHEGLDADPRIQVYIPLAQNARTSFISVAARTTGDPLQMTSAIRSAIRSVDSDMPMANIRTMDDMVDASLGQRKLLMLLLGSFSAIALLLASIGIYGVMSYSVTQRSRELGIRMALGAERPRVLALVVGQGMALAITGIVIGLAGAFALTRLLSTQLYEIGATDPITFGVVAGTLGAVALIATLLPAMRATRVDPVVALREE